MRAGLLISHWSQHGTGVHEKQFNLLIVCPFLVPYVIRPDPPVQVIDTALDQISFRLHC